MALIFLFSNQTADISDDTSDSLIEMVVSAVYPKFNELDNADRLYIIDNFSAPIRKAAHFCEFFVLGTVAFFHFITYPFKKKKLYAALPFLVGFLYSVSDELHQLFISGRACRILDIYIDFAGVLLSVIFFYLIWLRSDRVGQ